LIAGATALVLLGGAVLPFLNPLYVRFEQGRTGVAGLTGYTPAQLDTVTGALLGDLALWQGGFDEALNGTPVLKPAEIQHMLDVRGVFAGFFALVLAAVAVVLVAFRRAGAGTEARAGTWRAVSSGARGLAIGIAAAGVVMALAFDAAFEVFHRLFFSAGSYTFDPTTDKLVQLFPEAFWSETAMFVGLLAFVASVVTWWLARGRARRVAAGVTREVGAV
jgi:integral membrane protein (TIGR01906 family)